MTAHPRRLVVKFGGSVLSSGARIAEAARLVMEAEADEKLVVVSAPHGMTDQLASLVDEVPHRIDPADRASLLAFGERISARLFASILESQGVRVRRVEPEDPAWPIWTRGGSLNATIDVEASRQRAQERLAPILRTHVVVVCGFLGREDDAITTLRRGGSDTTALALASFLDASDVVLVKDVPGVLSADPDLVPDARPIPELAAAHLAELGRSGARVVAPEGLRFLNGDHRVRVIGFGASLLESAGTRVHAGPLPAVPLGGTSLPEGPGTGSVTVVFDEWGHAFRAVREALIGVPWLSVSATPNSMSIFLPEAEVMPLLRALHASDVFKAVTSRVGLEVLTAPKEAVPAPSASDSIRRRSLASSSRTGASTSSWRRRPTRRRTPRGRRDADARRPAPPDAVRTPFGGAHARGSPAPGDRRHPRHARLRQLRSTHPLERSPRARGVPGDVAGLPAPLRPQGEPEPRDRADPAVRGGRGGLLIPRRDPDRPGGRGRRLGLSLHRGVSVRLGPLLRPAVGGPDQPGRPGDAAPAPRPREAGGALLPGEPRTHLERPGGPQVRRPDREVRGAPGLGPPRPRRGTPRRGPTLRPAHDARLQRPRPGPLRAGRPLPRPGDPLGPALERDRPRVRGCGGWVRRTVTARGRRRSTSAAWRSDSPRGSEVGSARGLRARSRGCATSRAATSWPTAPCS